MANNNAHWFRGQKFPDGNFWQLPQTLDVANPEIPYLPLETPAAATGGSRHLAHMLPAVALVALGFFPAEEIQAVQHDLNAYRSPAAAVTADGHVIQQHSRVIITRAEAQPQPYDHHSRLFFGRTNPVVVTAGQPFFSWQPPTKLPEVAPIEWRADHSLLHRYRVGYQTVGQPWATWPKYVPPTLTTEDIRQPSHTALNLYRVGYQTVGQPWVTWARYTAPAFDQEQIRQPQADLFPYRQFAPVVVTATPPYWVWPASAAIANDGEEQVFRTNHDLALYPFRPHDAIVPAAADISEWITRARRRGRR